MQFNPYFATMESKLTNELATIRASLNHNTNKGDRAASAFRAFLADHLPRKLEVGHGEVTDTHGTSAGEVGGDHQVDALIINEYHPRFAKIEEPSLYLAEGVSGGAEIKSALSSKDIKAIVKQAVAFKKIKPAFRAGDMTFTNDVDMERFYNRLPYFLFAYESQLTLETLIASIRAEAASLGAGETGHFDAVFLLDRGAALNLGDGKGAIKMLNAEGAPCAGWSKTTNGVLMSLIGWLSGVLPSIQRNSPILLPYLVRNLKDTAAEAARSPS